MMPTYFLLERSYRNEFYSCRKESITDKENAILTEWTPVHNVNRKGKNPV